MKLILKTYFRCGQGKHPLINAMKDNLLAMGIEEDTIHSDPIYEPPNSIDEDLDDIQVLPVTKPPKPIQVTTVKEPIKTTTKRPTRPTTTTTTTTAVAPTMNDEFKVVCYYTNWAWYR